VATCVAISSLILVGLPTSAAVTCDEQQPHFVQLSSHPRIYRIDGLLSSAECDTLIGLGNPRLNTSEMGAVDAIAGDGDETSSIQRTSRTAFLDEARDNDHVLLQKLRKRWADAARLPLSLAEPTQVARYAAGEGYGLHLDASDDVLRTATLITYLSDGFDGGETCFPRVASAAEVGGGRAAGVMRPLAKLAAAGMLAKELSKGEQYCDATRAVLRVVPRKGDALLFFPLLPDGQVDHDAVHSSCQVRSAPAEEPKWIAQQWFTLPAAGTETAWNPRAGYFDL